MGEEEDTRIEKFFSQSKKKKKRKKRKKSVGMWINNRMKKSFLKPPRSHKRNVFAVQFVRVIGWGVECATPRAHPAAAARETRSNRYVESTAARMKSRTVCACVFGGYGCVHEAVRSRKERERVGVGVGGGGGGAEQVLTFEEAEIRGRVATLHATELRLLVGGGGLGSSGGSAGTHGFALCGWLFGVHDVRGSLTSGTRHRV